MKNLSAHGKNDGNTHDRRRFLHMLSGLGLMVTGSRVGGLEMSAGAQTPKDTAQSDDEQVWAVTLGRPDGPHPPFVSNSRRLLSPPELLDAPDEWIDRSLKG